MCVCLCGEASDSALHVHHATFLLDWNIGELSAGSVTTVSSGPPLKIREQLSVDYLILRQIPRIPGTDLS